MVSIFHLSWGVPSAIRLMPFGWVGVQIFFVISGLVIAGSANAKTARDFARGRFLRLYPAAWVAAAINGIVLLAVPLGVYQAVGVVVNPHPIAALSSVILLGNQFPGTAYWTLPVELSFYFLMFVLIVTGHVQRTRLIAGALILVSVPYTIALVLNAAGVLHWPWIELGYGIKTMLLVRHGPYFALGMMIWSARQRRFQAIDAVFTFLAMMLASGEIYARAVELAPKFAGGDHASVIDPLALSAEAFAAYLFGVAAITVSYLFSARVTLKPAPARLFRVAGLMTYPYYLLHEVVGGACLGLLLAAGLGLTSAIVASLLVVGVAAWLIVEFGEPRLRFVVVGIMARFAIT